MQFLFQHDLNPPENLDLALAQFWESQRAAAIAEEKGAANWRVVSASTRPACTRCRMPKPANAAARTTNRITPRRALRGEIGFWPDEVSRS